MDIELSTDMTTAQVEDSDDDLIIPLPLTPESYSLLQDVDCGDPVTLTSADGDKFIGEVLDWDEDHYSS